MQIVTYSQARQHLSDLLDLAETEGKVIIRRRDGRSFALIPQPSVASPLDVPSLKLDMQQEEVVALVREGRERDER